MRRCGPSELGACGYRQSRPVLQRDQGVAVRASLKAATTRSTSCAVVRKLLTEIRITRMPRQVVGPNQALLT